MTNQTYRWASSAFRLFLAVLVLVSGGVASTLSAAPRGLGPQPPPQYDGILVAFHNKYSLQARLDTLTKYGLVVDPAVQSPYFAKVRLSPAAVATGLDVKSAVNALNGENSVRVAEPDYLSKIETVPNDPHFVDQWCHQNVGQPIPGVFGGPRAPGTPGADQRTEKAWNSRTDASGIIVAVIDTGVDYTHPDLTNNILRNGQGAVIGFDFVNNDADPMDDNSHGTHCAGIIGAEGNNGIGVAGVCHKVKIMPLKAFTAAGFGSTSAEVQSVDFAWQNGAHITSNSWGGFGRSQLLHDAFQRAEQAGVLSVCASGNSSVDNDIFGHYPSNFSTELNGIVAVGASDNDDAMTIFSQWGKTTVNLMAPGQAILSTVPPQFATVASDPYEFFDGTSMATPQVAGAYALVKASAPFLGLAQLKAQVLNNVDVLPGLDDLCTTEGRLNVDKSLHGTLLVTSPNDGETFLIGQNVDIQWLSANFPQPHFVKIEASRDGGLTYPEVITANTPDDGLFTWTATGPFSFNCRIRITSVFDPAVDDESDADFTITDGQKVTICTNTQPIPIVDDFRSDADWVESPIIFPADMVVRGLEVSVDITHSYIGDLEVYLVAPDGTSVTLHDETGEDLDDIKTVYPRPTRPAESLTKLNRKLTKFIDPVTGKEKPWLLRVRDLNPGNIGTVNQWCLTVYGPIAGKIKVTSPNGGEKWDLGGVQPITWTSTQVSNKVNIDLSRDGGQTWARILSDVPNSGSAAYTATGPGTSSAKIRVEDAAEAGISDVSDNTFQILDPFLTVLRPANGEQIAVGKPYKIQWDSLPLTGTVTIEVSRDNGQTFTPITTSAPNTGSFTWTSVTDPDTTGAQIRVRANSGPARQGLSGIFTIRTLSLKVLTPAGGDTWWTHTQQNITWSSVGVDGNVRIELSRDGGSTWEDVRGSTANDFTETLTVSGPATDNARVRITSVDDPTLTGTSSSFAIKETVLTLTAPNGGEKWGIGTNQTVTWNTTGPAGFPAKVDILLSRDGGVTFDPSPIFVDAPNTGQAVWKVIGPATDKALIRIQAAGLPPFDVSNGVFQIVAPTMQVTFPNGGEELRVGQSRLLSWNAQGLGPTSRVDVELSRDGGASWQPLFLNTLNDGVESWTVTGPDATQALLRVTSLELPVVLDTSNDFFRIVTPGVNVLGPTNPDRLFAGSQTEIRWEGKGFDGGVNIELTRDGGNTWTTLFSNTANDGVQPWQVTGPGATNCRVRVSSVSSPTVQGESSGPFVIVLPTLTLGRPNGSVQMVIGSQEQILWSSNGFAGSIKIEISRDSGQNWTTLQAATANDGSEPWTVEGPTSDRVVFRISSVSDPSISDTSERVNSIVTGESPSPPGAIQVLTLSPNPVTAGRSARGTVTLKLPAAANTVVTLASSNSAVASTPRTVTVRKGRTTATFSVRARTAGQTDISATVGGVGPTVRLTVQSAKSRGTKG